MDEARCDFVQGMKYQRILEQTYRPSEWPMGEGIAHYKQFFAVWNEDKVYQEQQVCPITKVNQKILKFVFEIQAYPSAN